MRIVIETDDRDARVSGATAEEPGPSAAGVSGPPSELAAAAAALGAIDAGPAPEGAPTGSAGAPPLPAVPSGAPAAAPVAGLSAGSAPGVDIEGPVVEIDVDDVEE
jgi:hypothetical protein